MGKKSKFLKELKRLEQKKVQSSSQDTSLSSIEEEKMSKVLEDFMSPYLHLSKDLSGKERLFTIGVIAWNASLYPASERKEITDLLFSSMVIGDDEIMQEELTEIIEELVKRKLTYFGNDQRLIIDFSLTKIGKADRLSVTFKYCDGEGDS